MKSQVRILPLHPILEYNMNIEKINHYWDQLDGMFSRTDIAFYISIVDKFNDPAHFVEVGSFKGKSSSAMAVEICNSGKDIQFDCVDSWSSSGGTGPSDDETYQCFVNNMKPVSSYYKAIKLPSVEAASLYLNNTLDFVFLDAGHEYKSIHEDIIAWLPKIKTGGIISGHDCHYPPVIKAVNELLTNVKLFGECWYCRKN